MKICGIIAEYNPFHNGHKYQIEELKRRTNCDAVVAIMSGNFLQRGIPASFDKFTRAKMAIENGIDVVIELPTYYATSSSEYFALGGVGILNSLNCIDDICFGAENDNLELLSAFAKIFKEEPDEYKKELQKNLDKGLSFPKARCEAICDYIKHQKEENIFKNYSKDKIEETLLDPNNILAIEYLKALMHFNSSINPIAIKRKGTSYNSVEMNEAEGICSSTAIREQLSKDNITCLKSFVPDSVYKEISSNYLTGKSQIELENYEKEILFELRKKSLEELSHIADVSEGLENLINKVLSSSFTINDLIENLKSKRYTRTRIQRILIHTLLNITQEDLQKNKHEPQYARVLAVSKNGKKALSEISKSSRIPIVTNVSKFMKEATKEQKEMLEKDILATNIYTLGYKIPEYRKINLDYTTSIN